jgi:hypothetical protein
MYGMYYIVPLRPPLRFRWSAIQKGRRVGAVCDLVNCVIDALAKTLTLPDARLAAWTLDLL